MTESPAPMVRLDLADAANAPVLSYNVPDPTSYPGRSYITLDFGDNDPFAVDAAVEPGSPAVVPAEAASLRTRIGDVRLGPPRPVSDGDQPGLVQEMLNAGVIGTASAVAEPAAGVVTPMFIGRFPRGFPRGVPHNPPQPQATLTIVSPAEGSVFEAGPDGFDVPIVVTAKFTVIRQRPPTITIATDGASVQAAPTGDLSGDTWHYTGSLRIRPGSFLVSASLEAAGKVFATMSPRRIEVRLLPQPPARDTTPPILFMDAPAEGVSLVLPTRGTIPLQLRGRVSDPDGTLASCDVSLDGANPPTTVNVEPGGSFTMTQDLQVEGDGQHTLRVRATNADGLVSEVTRPFSVSVNRGIAKHRLMLVECLRLSNFLGRYGAGRIVQTFSLLPGEKTSITIRSFESAKTEASETSSVFDSFSGVTSNELSSAVASEDVSKSESEEQLKSQVNVKAGVTWGFGSASVEAGLAYGTSSAREQLTKNVTNGASRHAAEKSSKRDIKVEGAKAETATSENEQITVRTLENTNLARTLNFVFRQTTQEFISLLHLVDVRVAHLVEWFQPDGTRSVEEDPERPNEMVPVTDYEEVALPQLHDLLQRICASPEKAAMAEAVILRQLDAMFDYRGERQAIVDEASRAVPSRDPLTGRIRTQPDSSDPTRTTEVTEQITWTRFDPDLKMTWPHHGPSDPAPAFSITVPGVILGVTENTLRTDGIVVDAFLGGGPALDAYSTELQRTAIAAREAEANQAQAETARTKLGMEIVAAGETEKAELYAKVFAPPEDGHGNGAVPDDRG